MLFRKIERSPRGMLRTTCYRGRWVGNCLRVSLLALVLSLSTRARADLIFSEDFDNLADGTAITTSNTSLNIVRALAGSTGSLLESDNPSPFGAGASARIVTSSTSAGTNMQAIGERGFSAVPVGTLAFSLQTPTAFTANNYITISSGSSVNTVSGYYSSSNNAVYTPTAATWGIRIEETGTLSINTAGSSFDTQGFTFVENSSYRLIITFNASDSEVVYDGGTLAPGTADLRISGTLVADDFTMRNPSLASIAFAMKVAGGTGNTNAYTLDDIAFYDAAVVPEPSALLLGGLGLGLFVVHRVKRRRGMGAGCAPVGS